MRSASSLALRSAASKSMTSPPPSFFAPSLEGFLPPRTLALRGPLLVEEVLRSVDECTARLAGVGASELARGDVERAGPAPSDVRNGEGVRPTTGGVAVREVGGVGRLIAGLSQEEKKSSSGSPAGVEEPSAEPFAITSVITTSSGY